MSYLGEDTKKLGFGMMRLPKNEDNSFDIPQICDMVDAFMGAGCTYFDTARVYKGSERVTRQTLVERYPRDSFTLATKNAAWCGYDTREDAIAAFDTSLEETGAGYFDYYLLHNIGSTRTHFFEDWGFWEWGRNLKEKGLIRNFGFSFHDNAELLRELLEKYPFVDFVQLQINWVDWEDGNVQSRKNWEVAREFGKPVVIMEPLKGGILVNPPDSVMEIFREANPDRTAVEWGLRFAMNTEGLIAALSGMNTLEGMRQNLATMKSLTPLSDKELETFDRARSKFKETLTVPCSSCHYCMENCPVGMNISGIMESLNRGSMFGAIRGWGGYQWHAREVKGSECLRCYQCEDVCPQHIDIVAQIEKAVGLYEKSREELGL